MTLALRVAQHSDLNAIVRIETEAFGNPWPWDAYVQELEREHGVVRVAELGAAGVVGFSCTWHVQLGAGEARVVESHLLRVAVDQRHRGGGIGGTLVEALIAHARTLGSSHITLEVASQNAAAVGLYAAHGFREIARRVAYYRTPPDDAVILRRELSGSAESPGAAD